MEIIAARRGKYFQRFALFPLFPCPHEAPRGRRHRTRFFARNGFCAGKSPRFPFWPSGRSSKIFYTILRRLPRTVRLLKSIPEDGGALSSSMVNRRPGQSPKGTRQRLRRFPEWPEKPEDAPLPDSAAEPPEPSEPACIHKTCCAAFRSQLRNRSGPPPPHAEPKIFTSKRLDNFSCQCYDMY